LSFSQQDPALIVSGERDHLHNDWFAAFVKEIHLRDTVNERGAVYLENENQYREFISAHAAKLEQVTKQDFWSREDLKSSAFRSNWRRRRSGRHYVCHYRTPQNFDSFTRELIETFSFLIGFAVRNHRLSVENAEFWKRHRADSLSLSVSEIVASLAHNSGNLLSSISFRFAGFADRVRKSSAEKIDKHYVQDFLEQIQEPLNELCEDFARLKEYRRLDDFSPQSCRIEDLIDSSLDMLRIKFQVNRISIKNRYAPTPQILCDKNQIQHVLINLLLNAVDAIERKGSITIETEVKGNHVRIRITDTGMGIPAELRSKIFEPFFTTKKHGAGEGFGLPVSRYIVSNHGGEIEFTSRVGKGTTFTVYLPIG
jgi:signal transduction histidine kinase